MDKKPNGYRYKPYSLWEVTKQTPYDYERYGLVNKIMSRPIWESQNPVLKIMLSFYESSITFVLKYIDILKHFKDVHWKNR